MIYPFLGKYPKLGEDVYISPGVYIIGDVEIGDRTSIWFGTIIRGDEHPIRIGRDSNIQDASIVHVALDCGTFMGDRVSVGHAAQIHGCTVEDDVLIGMGAIVLNHAVVKSNTIVAAGALVPERAVIPSGVVVAGVPAKVIREIRPEELEHIQILSKGYERLAGQHKASYRSEETHVNQEK